jgi:hypothetical protein
MSYVVTEETLKQNALIPDDTIERDIADTQREIEDLRIRADAFDNLWKTGPGHEAKMAAFRRDNAFIQIRERETFVEKLNALLAKRKEAKI